ncbi:hypothetical protein F3Y22_tig00111993pilonHSYRG00028 [Hibiscus syriacus]|uniref:Peroxin-13 n=1 Tax=Hibiscus syriacus TaxID=106335 RepID=A0A6A2XWC4_HIBSY|nr:hypothetical protein F3Y22_tig00111993pilonHSYRG00028 [Hibiscus syriacus]
MQGGVNFFGWISILIDQNTQAFHMFMSSLLQLFDRTGVLYGELARFVLRLLGIKIKPRKINQPGPGGLPGPHNPHGNQNILRLKRLRQALHGTTYGVKRVALSSILDFHPMIAGKITRNFGKGLSKFG